LNLFKPALLTYVKPVIVHYCIVRCDFRLGVGGVAISGCTYVMCNK